MQRFEHVSTQTKYYYNLGIHEVLLLVVGIPQLYRISWTFVYPHPKGDSATSPIMKRAKYNKQSASRKMSWMSFLDSKMMEEEV
jgi:hypothetical protein